MKNASGRRPAFNPFLPLWEYIPDGEPHVFGDRVYLFGSHDKEGGKVYCEEGDYVGWSAPVNDLSDWRYEGVLYTAERHPGGKGHYLYAPDVVQGNDGKFYLYYCLDDSRYGLHVAVCDAPCGEYRYLGEVRNADKTPLRRFITADPAVINDGGTIRLYYGWALSLVAAGAHGQTAELPAGGAIPGLAAVEAKMFHHTVEEVEREDSGTLMGAVTCTLEDDMLTVKAAPVRIVPGQLFARGTAFEGHAFYEASSIRKIGDTYYFIYSSENSNELCYATSRYPDRDFVFRGTIISNGDVGNRGRRAEERLNQTANNHGSIEKINGKRYIFYHRQTHSSSYSRQACAEPVEILADGSIPQVEMTSCGLNGGLLAPEGEFPAAIACNLTNGHMPHITNRVLEADIPYITHAGGERFITNMKEGDLAGFKYFDFGGTYRLEIVVRGEEGAFEVAAEEGAIGTVRTARAQEWTRFSADICLHGVHALYFTRRGGAADFLKFTLKKQ